MNDKQLQRIALYVPGMKAGADSESELAAATGLATDVVAADLANAEFCAALLAAVEEPAGRDEAAPTKAALCSPDSDRVVTLETLNTPAEPAQLAAQARRVTAGLLCVVERAMDAGELDVDDAAKLLPRVHQVHNDIARIELARDNGKADLPVFNITFQMTGAISAEPASLVVDAEPIQRAGAVVADLLRGSAASTASSEPGDAVAFLSSVRAGIEQAQED